MSGTQIQNARAEIPLRDPATGMTRTFFVPESIKDVAAIVAGVRCNANERAGVWSSTLLAYRDGFVQAQERILAALERAACAHQWAGHGTAVADDEVVEKCAMCGAIRSRAASSPSPVGDDDVKGASPR